MTLAEFSPEETALILDEAVKIKAMRKSRIPYRPLQGRTLAMVFQKPSNRTRVSFEAGMFQMGGASIVLNMGDTQLGRGERCAQAGATRTCARRGAGRHP